jgi:5,10-methylenetetrahydromethanopterin reductase
MTSAQAFAASAARAESLGWDMGLLPCNPLKVPDPYVSLALAALQTKTLHLGTLLDTPIIRHPSALAGSICTVAELAPGRIHTGLGVGDTAVRFNGLAPAGVAAIEQAVTLTRGLIHGEAMEVGAARPARLNHAAPVPVWVAAQGPKNLKMAGRCADGVWLRVGRHPANIAMAWQAVCEGAREAGRDPQDLQVGLIFHTALSDTPSEAILMGKAMAAGYYEYSKFLFDAPGFVWSGESAHSLQAKVYPDFHHHADPVFAGSLLDFLPDEVADAFALYGSWQDIAQQLEQVLESLPMRVDYVLPHPVLPKGPKVDYMGQCAEHLIPVFS